MITWSLRRISRQVVEISVQFTITPGYSFVRVHAARFSVVWNSYSICLEVFFLKPFLPPCSNTVHTEEHNNQWDELKRLRRLFSCIVCKKENRSNIDFRLHSLFVLINYTLQKFTVFACDNCSVSVHTIKPRGRHKKNKLVRDVLFFFAPFTTFTPRSHRLRNQ